MGGIKINWPAAQRLGAKAADDAAGDFTEDAMRFSMEESPVRTGHLRYSHIIVHIAIKHWLLLNLAYYSLFVHEGHNIVAWGHQTDRYRAPNRWMHRGIDRAMAAWQ